MEKNVTVYDDSSGTVIDLVPIDVAVMTVFPGELVHAKLCFASARVTTRVAVLRWTCVCVGAAGAVCLYQGSSYLVSSLDLDRCEAHVSLATVPYYTKSVRHLLPCRHTAV
jgi:hypothetical protein